MENQTPAQQTPPPVPALSPIEQEAARATRLMNLQAFRKSFARYVAVGLLGFLAYFHQAELRQRVPVVVTYLKNQYIVLTGGKVEGTSHNVIEQAIAAQKERDNELDTIMDIGANKSHSRTATVVAASAPGKTKPGERTGLATAMDSARNNAALVDEAMSDAPAPTPGKLAKNSPATR